MLRSIQFAALAAALAAAGCSSGPADEIASSNLTPVTSAVTEVQLSDGSAVHGELVTISVDEMKFKVDGESEPRLFARDDVDPMSWYLARSHGWDLDVDEHLELARYSFDNGLYEVGEVQMAKVIELDPSLESQVTDEIVQIQEKRSARYVDAMNSAVAMGDDRGAIHYAAKIITDFPRTQGAVSANEVIDQFDRQVVAVDDPETSVQLVSNGTSASLSKAGKYAGRGKKRNLTALKASSQSSQRSSFENSIKDYDRAIKLLDGVLADDSSAAEDLLVAQATRDEVVKDAVEVRLNLAGLYLNRGSYPQAQETAAEAVALDPTNEAAKAYLTRVEFVSSESERVRKLGKIIGKKYRYGS